MLGYYRYILAMLVASSHLWTEIIWWQGIYAVFGFYVISGYLMTLVLNKSYNGVEGAWRFSLNRILRIYPVYWVCLILGLITLSIFMQLSLEVPDSGRRILGLRESKVWGDWVKNLSFFGPDSSKYAITQAWSLRVEMTFYVLMMVLCKRLWIVVLWLLTSIGICVFHEFSGVNFAGRYATVQGASIAFSLGAMVYYLRQKWTMNKLLGMIFVVLFFAHFILAFKIWSFPFEYVTLYGFKRATDYGLYAHSFLAALLLWVILDSEGWIKSKPRIKRAGRYLGNLAYSVFLCHWIVAYLIMMAGVDYDDKLLFFPATFIGINLLAILLYHGVERPIDLKFRDRIRGQKVIE